MISLRLGMLGELPIWTVAWSGTSFDGVEERLMVAREQKSAERGIKTGSTHCTPRLYLT
jgi:hypothetical protein